MLTKSGLHTFLAFGAVVALAACAEPPTAARSTAASLRSGGLSATAPKDGELTVCKVAVNGANGVQFDFSLTITDENGVVSGPTTVHVNSGECNLVASTDVNGSDVFHATITEQTPPQGWGLTDIVVATSTSEPGTVDKNAATASAVRFGNDGGSIVTFTNTYTPPASSCTFTKGYYRNHATATAALIPTTILVGNASLTAAQAQAILNATPGKPGGITFSSNDLLNLVQQLISAILNGGTSGPASVQTAINSANAHIFISGGKAITTNLTQTGISSLITALDNFNSGKFAGFPHCGDD